MNGEEIDKNDTMLKAVKGLSPNVDDYKDTIEKAIKDVALKNDAIPPNTIQEYFVIFIGKREQNVNVSGDAGDAEIYETICMYNDVIDPDGYANATTYLKNKNDDRKDGGDKSHNTSNTTIIVKKDNENPIVLYNRDNKMLKAESNNIFHLIDTIVSPVLGQQIGDNMNVAEKIFFKGLPATPTGGNPPVQVTEAGGNRAGGDGEGGNRAAGGEGGNGAGENGAGGDGAGERPATVATANTGATQDPVTVANPGGNTPEVQTTEEPVQSNTSGTGGGGGWGLGFFGGEGGRGGEPDDMENPHK